MIAVKFRVEHTPEAQATLRPIASPVREEWQQDGSWTGLFDVSGERAEKLRTAIESLDADAQVTEIESEDDIPGFRMALYLFD